MDSRTGIEAGDRPVSVLLVEDDEDDYVIIRNMLSKIPNQDYELGWVSEFEKALEETSRSHFDLFLVDYRLGIQNGLEFLRILQSRGDPAPVILLTGKGDHEIDVQAMKSGASDYLEKGDLNPVVLERSIRYTVERARNLQALRESERKLRNLSEKLLNAQENERKIVAREIHDGLGSTLTTIRYALEQKLSARGGGESIATIPLEEIVEMVRNAVEESRKISSSLRPSVLDDLGLLPALNSLTREWSKVYGGIRLDKQVNVREADIPERLKIVIYRIVQEALNNISKHSRAGNVLIELNRSDDGIDLRIEDDGSGFDAAHVTSSKTSSNGMGIDGMRERTALSRGTFELRSRKEEGTVVRAHWPASEPSYFQS
jgi:signal transduction histidine kinase